MQWLFAKTTGIVSQLVKKISLRRCTSSVLALWFREEIVRFELAEFALALTKICSSVDEEELTTTKCEFRGFRVSRLAKVYAMFVSTTRSAIARYSHLRPQKDMKCKF